MKAAFVLPGILLALTFCAHAQDVPDDFDLEIKSFFTPEACLNSRAEWWQYGPTMMAIPCGLSGET